MTQVKMVDNPEPSLKQCSNCHEWFEKATFPPGRARCRKCHLERQRFSVWKSTLKKKYGITPEIYQAMYKDHGGKCYFCDVCKPDTGHDRLVIDHKKNGFVRGLLCRLCNANWVDEYRNLPKEYKDSPRTNAYLRRGETGDYIEGIKRGLASGANGVCG